MIVDRKWLFTIHNHFVKNRLHFLNLPWFDYGRFIGHDNVPNSVTAIQLLNCQHEALFT